MTVQERSRGEVSGVLFGVPVLDGAGDESLVSKILEILERELAAGRWEVGQKLPVVSVLARESGLNRGTLQYAIEKLVQSGVVKKKKYHGYFVEDLRALRQNSSMKTVELWASEKIDEDPVLNSWHENLQIRFLKKEADLRGWNVRLRTFSEEEVGSLGADLQSCAKNCDGVISIQSFPHAFRSVLNPEDTPLVFWRDVYHMSESAPNVSHDQPEGFALMTRRLIDLGHREIVFLSQSPAFERIIYSMDEDDMEREGVSRFEGYARTMRAAGLSVNEDAANFRAKDNEGIRDYLQKFSSATAIVCGAGHISWKVVFMAQALGVSVPEQLSVVAPGPAWLQEHGPIKYISGVGFHGEHAAKLCFDEVLRQSRERTMTFSRTILGPQFIDGCTIAPPLKA